MTVHELSQLLDDLDPDAEVRVAHQPNWPFEYSIADVVEIEPDEDEDDPPHRAIDDDDDEFATVIYLVEGNQLGYLPGHVAAEIGWK